MPEVYQPREGPISVGPLRGEVDRYGPFVMGTREEIHEAVRDFQGGRLG